MTSKMTEFFGERARIGRNGSNGRGIRRESVRGGRERKSYYFSRKHPTNTQFLSRANHTKPYILIHIYIDDTRVDGK